MGIEQTAENIGLEGIEDGNRFFTKNMPDKDQTRLYDGTVAYRILGYANTSEEAHEIIGKDHLRQGIVSEMSRIASVIGMEDENRDNLIGYLLKQDEINDESGSPEPA